MTSYYRITSALSGEDLGIYKAASEAEALDAMAREAGYPSYAKACEAAPVEDGEIVVEAIDDPLTPLNIDDLAPELRADMDAPVEEFTAWKHVPLTESVTVYGDRHYHIVHHAESGRGGIVLVGSGSSGRTEWTDADTPEEVLRRYLIDEMRP